MKVRELIEQLQTQDPEAEVWGEGCDCSNPAVGVSAERFSPVYGEPEIDIVMLEVRV